MKAALVHALFMCGVLCADFCVRIFVRGFLVRIFGTEFSVQIFRCGFFVQIVRAFCFVIWAQILVRILGRILQIFCCKETAGERKKSSEKPIKIFSTKSSPIFPLQKSSPNPSQDIRQSVLTWTQRRCGSTP